MITITVDTRKAVVTGKELITTGSAGIEIQLSFSSDWEGLDRFVIIRNGDDYDSKTIAMLGDTGITELPVENCASEYVDEPIFVGVYGENEEGTIVIPTIWASIGPLREGATYDDSIVPEDAETMREFIRALADDACGEYSEQAAASATASAESASASAASASIANAAKMAAQAAQAEAETAAARDTAAWLNEHITNPDSPPLDRTLMSSSAAAPADMVGDLKNTLDLLNPSFEALNSFALVNGYINTNGGISGTSSSARKCTKYFSVPENCSFAFVGESDHQNISGIAFYDRRKRFISSLVNSGTKGTWVSGVIPPGAYFARISTANTINYKHGFKITATGGYTGISEKESDLLIDLDNIVNAAYVDTTTGTDALISGTKTQPFKSINYALTFGYRKLFVKPGLYNENISLDGGEFEIIPWVEGQEYSKTTAPFRPKIKIIKGTKLETVSSGTDGIVQADYTAQSNSNVYKVFVSKTLAPTTQGSLALEYNALLVGDMPNTDTSSGPFSPYKQRLYTPVLTETELNNTEGTFWYNGSDTIKIHAWNNKPDGDYYIPDDDSAVGISLSNMTKVYLEDVKILGCYTDCLYLNYCDNVSANSCEFGYCAKGMGIGLDYTNARISDCHAYACSADGFNLHGYGYSEIVNCSAFYCGDDGISHHQGCSGFIDGGEWAFNSSGGIAPSFGSQIDVRNVYAHDNSRGIQYLGQADANRNVSLSNSLSVNNGEYDIYLDMYVVDAWNCVCKNIFERYGSARSHINKYNFVILE